MSKEKKTIQYLLEKKKRGEKITRIVAYDYPMAALAEAAGIDMISVGDSIAIIMLGEDTTIHVKLDFLITHAKAVRRGAPNAFIMADMPFLTYQVSIKQAIRNAGRFIEEAGIDAVKLEGGSNVLETIRALTSAGIPVVAHSGLTPEAVGVVGGYKTQARDAESAFRLLKEVRALEEAGAIIIALESIPAEVVKVIREKVSVPIMGVGVGPYCDSPGMNPYDFTGYSMGRTPKYAKRYANVSEIIATALKQYIQEIQTGVYPDEKQSYKMLDGEYESFLDLIKG